MLLSSELELLLAVLEAPDDDGPRLVYADVLQERGDLRGEFIPLQCTLARPSARGDPERFQAMRTRESELLTAHGAEWIAQSIPFQSVALFHRGFIEELMCLPGELLHRGLELVAPVRVLHLWLHRTGDAELGRTLLLFASVPAQLTLRGHHLEKRQK